MGAENDMSIEVGPLDSQIGELGSFVTREKGERRRLTFPSSDADYFSNTYNKVLVLRPKNQEIVFVTHHLLHYLGESYLSSSSLVARIETDFFVSSPFQDSRLSPPRLSSPPR